MDPAIRVDSLSKQYRLGLRDAMNGSFREVLTALATMPARRFRKPNGPRDEEWLWALRDVSFEVQRGEVLGVIGRNGAGKSTLLKILSRITAPTGGRVELRGRVGSLLEVGTGFHPDLTGRENIYLNGAILGMRGTDIRRQFDAIVEFAEVARFLDTPVKRYSSGMYLRLAFSVAAHLDTDILLVDEVLAVGDAAFQKRCLGKMQDVSRGGRTVIFISHNMSAISTLCTRALVIDAGRPVFDGGARAAVRHYLENTLTDAALTWDVSQVPRSRADVGSLVRVERVSTTTARRDGFRFGEPLKFRVEVLSHAVVEEAECAIGLDDTYGSRVVTFMSNDARLTTCPGGRYAIEVTVPPFGLRPGKYLMSVSLYSGGQYHDYLAHFGAVSVAPLQEDGEGHVEDDADWGPIAVPSVWSVSESTTGALT